MSKKKYYKKLCVSLLLLGLCTSPIHAADNPIGITTPTMDATTLGNTILNNYGTILGGASYTLPFVTRWGGMFGYHDGDINYTFNNIGNINITHTGSERVYGMHAYTSYNGSHSQVNTGTMSIDSASVAYMMFAVGTGSHSQINNGTMTGIGGQNFYALYASGNGSHSQVNNGTININSASNTYALYIFADESQSQINTGNITLSGDDSYGMRVKSYNNGSHSQFNSGTMKLSGVDTKYGMYADVDGKGSHTQTNSATMSISGENFVYGMYAAADGTGSHTQTNSGTMNISGDSAVIGMHSHVYDAGSHTQINSGFMSVSGDDNIRGMYTASYTGSHTQTNSGIMNVSGAIGVHGLWVESDNVSSLSQTNSGTMNVRGDNDVYGMRAEGVDSSSHSQTNSGILNVSSENDVYGMLANSVDRGSHSQTNSGEIIVQGSTSAMGMIANTKYGSHTLVNTGILNVHTLSHDSMATAMAVKGIATGTDISRVHNTGVINVSAPQGKAYETFGYDPYSIGTYAVTLRSYSSNDAVFSGNNDNGSIGTVHFDANSKLILRPGTPSQGFKLGHSYAVASMISLDVNPDSNQVLMQQQSAINGFVGGVSSEVPFLQAQLSGPSHSPFVSLKVAEDELPAAASLKQAKGQALGQYGNIARALKNQAIINYKGPNRGLASGSAATYNEWEIFLTPYVNFNNDTNTTYHGNNVGISGGLSYRLSENFSLGAHFDFNVANNYAHAMDMNTKTDSFAVGVHSTINIMPQWYVIAQASTAFSQSDATFDVGGSLNFDNHAEFYGQSLYASISSGYSFELAPGHTITPEVGLSYLGLRSSGFSLHLHDPALHYGGVYDVAFDDSYYTAFYGNVGINWRSEWQIGADNSLAITTGLGARHRLSSHGLENSMRIGVQKYTDYTSENLTTWLTDMGVEYRKGNFSINVSYDGQYGWKEQSHGGKLIVTLAF